METQPRKPFNTTRVRQVRGSTECSKRSGQRFVVRSPGPGSCVSDELSSCSAHDVREIVLFPLELQHSTWKSIWAQKILLSHAQNYLFEDIPFQYSFDFTEVTS